jgi:hypothetical protein
MEDFRPTDLSYHKVVDDRPTYHAKFTTMTFGYSLPKAFFKVYEKYESYRKIFLYYYQDRVD